MHLEVDQQAEVGAESSALAAVLYIDAVDDVGLYDTAAGAAP